MLHMLESSVLEVLNFWFVFAAEVLETHLAIYDHSDKFRMAKFGNLAIRNFQMSKNMCVCVCVCVFGF